MKKQQQLYKGSLNTIIMKLTAGQIHEIEQKLITDYGFWYDVPKVKLTDHITPEREEKLSNGICY